jgi:hypothetical protein
MLHNSVTHDDEIDEEVELGDDEDATLADDLLDEVSDDEVVADDELMEGFGILPEAAVEEDEEEEDKEGEDGDEPLEEDAEDVDFDRFDDVDEL